MYLFTKISHFPAFCSPLLSDTPIHLTAFFIAIFDVLLIFYGFLVWVLNNNAPSVLLFALSCSVSCPTVPFLDVLGFEGGCVH
jgi:hypothetical protein